MDQLTEDFAYFLKYLFGYAGFDSALYADYDDTADYSQDGDFAPSAGHINNNSGYGYGGIGGTDYIYSGDHTGLAYGSVTGPDPKYYGDSIVDPKSQMTELLEGYSKSFW